MGNQYETCFRTRFEGRGHRLTRCSLWESSYMSNSALAGRMPCSTSSVKAMLPSPPSTTALRGLPVTFSTSLKQSKGATESFSHWLRTSTSRIQPARLPRLCLNCQVRARADFKAHQGRAGGRHAQAWAGALSNAQKDEARGIRNEDGCSLAEIARLFGVSVSTVRRA